MARQSGIMLYNEAYDHFAAGRIRETIDCYRRAVIQIVANENIHQQVGNQLPPTHASELLVFIWQNMVSFFNRSAHEGFTQENYPEAYELIYAYRPTSTLSSHPNFKGSPAKLKLLKAMQIIAGLTLGLMAWEKGDRPTAAKRYKESLDAAAAYPTFTGESTPETNLDCAVAFNVKQMKDNLAILVSRDALLAGEHSGRKEVLELRNSRVAEDGTLEPQNTFTVSTDPCGREGCGKRGVGYKRCGGCKQVTYCGAECQKLDWKAKHKTACRLQAKE
ncbi:unnamed protein product [Mycena citricolor]|uniref:MYND-type domain-containing protein n=1 Tax=Mycena citricolor TaxID=2018698 RepID=A0AAD2HBP7_9AGAR|nr:unnamed protein product [Mycena citricolor]